MSHKNHVQYWSRLAVMMTMVILVSTSFCPAETDDSSVESAIARQRKNHDTIKIRNPKELSVDRLPAKRVPVGEVGHYKPCIIRLEGDELLLVCYLENVPGLPTRQYRSMDGGRTWRGPEPYDVGHGGEPYLSKSGDGALLLTGGPWGYRSEDGGRTWFKRVEPPDFAARVKHNLARNILRLNSGSLLQIVDVHSENGKPYRNGNPHVAQSTDGGLSWTQTDRVQVDAVPEDYPSNFFGEAWLWQARSGKLYALVRVNHRWYPLPGRVLSNLELASAACSLFHFDIAPVEDIGDTHFDEFNRLKVFSSTDLGWTWQPGQDLGDYGYMYPSILRLKDGRLLLTFTVRSIDPPLGVRAVVGTEHETGFDFDFDHDVIMIDTKTPIGRVSRGGFGPTVQLDDGTLVTSYSYWPAQDKRMPGNWRSTPNAQCEVVRWRLPDAE